MLGHGGFCGGDGLVIIPFDVHWLTLHGAKTLSQPLCLAGFLCTRSFCLSVGSLRSEAKVAM